MFTCMIRLPILLLTLLLPTLSFSKERYYSRFNTDAFWQTLVPDSPGTTIRVSSADTAIIVASNREPAPGQLRFMSEIRGDGTIRYFIVYSRAGSWHIQQHSSLRDAINVLPQKDKDWIVYTEGMGKIFTTDLDRGMNLAGQYGVHVLLLDYPSIRSSYKGYRNYRFAYRNARIAYKDFARVLDTFRRLRTDGDAGSGSISLFFHSMGSNVMRKLARKDMLVRFNDTKWVDNIILNAPCVPRRRSRQWMDRIHFAKRMYVHYNSQDRTLKLARIVGFRQILGEHPKQPVSDSALFINFNTLCGEGHSNFLSLYGRLHVTREALLHYNTLFHGGAVDLHDATKYRKTAYRSIGWDLLPAGH